MAVGGRLSILLNRTPGEDRILPPQVIHLVRRLGGRVRWQYVDVPARRSD
ncbi:MAG: hypothetical protein AAF604_07240 [Acidobacteriota bacterium]